jgi:hypothetical protein
METMQVRIISRETVKPSSVITDALSSQNLKILPLGPDVVQNLFSNNLVLPYKRRASESWSVKEITLGSSISLLPFVRKGKGSVLCGL